MTPSPFNLRDYQTEIASKSVKILRTKRIVYIVAEVRTGKTLMALETARLFGAKNVLFLTKKLAIQSIQDDYSNFGFSDEFNLTVINDESMKKAVDNYDLVIHDEHHRFGSFPKPSVGAKNFKLKWSEKPMIFLSGTPTPEGYSQIYHQFWISKFSPFGHIDFYKWAKEFVNVTQRNHGYGLVNDYSKANESDIMRVVDEYMVRFSQKQAGFSSEIKEHVLMCRMSDTTYWLANKLKKELAIQGKDELIMADTAVKLMSKLHQLFSGTIKFESGNSKVIDTSKADLINIKFEGKKIAIFYKFKAELLALKEVLGDNLTTDLDEFNKTDKSIALQIIRGREGISLKEADHLVYFNIDYSATSYWQSRDRLTTMERLKNEIYYIFAIGGIEEHIFKAVNRKKSYTSKYFLRDFNVKIPKKDNQAV